MFAELLISPEADLDLAPGMKLRRRRPRAGLRLELSEGDATIFGAFSGMEEILLLALGSRGDRGICPEGRRPPWSIAAMAGEDGRDPELARTWEPFCSLFLGESSLELPTAEGAVDANVEAESRWGRAPESLFLVRVARFALGDCCSCVGGGGGLPDGGGGGFEKRDEKEDVRTGCWVESSLEQAEGGRARIVGVTGVTGETSLVVFALAFESLYW